MANERRCGRSAPAPSAPPLRIASAGREMEQTYPMPLKCNLCGADDYVVFYDWPTRGETPGDVADFVASTDRYDRYGRIVRCRRCGLVYTNPRPTDEILARAYSEAVDHAYVEEDASRSINAHISLHTIRRFAQCGRMLDVGCSTGYLINAARLHFDVRGVEPSRWAAEHAAKQLRLDVLPCALEDADLPAEHFDVVSMNDVIEHLTDPLGALRRANRILRPGGILYLVTPDIGSLSARLMGRRWWGLRPAHIYYFSKKTMTALLELAGFKVVLLKSYGRIFTYGYWLSRLRSYPSPVYRAASTLIEAFSVGQKFLYLDTRDSMEICARRK